MGIEKIDYKMPEGDLNFFEIMALSALLKDASVAHIEYLIKQFNENPENLEDYEIYFLINYVASNMVESVKNKGYALYSERTPILDDEYICLYKKGMIKDEDAFLEILRGTEKRLILSKEESEMKDVIFSERRNIDTRRLMKKFSIDEIIKDLEAKGFNFLETKGYMLAFCEERNITFYAKSIDELLKYYGSTERYFFQQPRATYDNRIVVTKYTSIENCESENSDFPLFSERSYLWLYNKGIDNDTPFNSSMKRIAKYPELYNAVGEENQRLIDSIVQREKGYSRRISR